MAYTPTLADAQEALGITPGSASSPTYTPTLADAQEAMAQKNSEALGLPPSSGNPLLNFGRGATDAIQNTIASAGNLGVQGGNALINSQVMPSALTSVVHPALNAVSNALAQRFGTTPNAPLPIAKNGSGLSYDLGNIAGNTAAFIGGGEGLDALRGVGEGLPVIGKGLEWLGGNGVAGVTRRALGTGAYGAATNPNAPITGGIEGALGSSLLDAVPGIAGLIGKGFPLVQPQKYLDQILGNMGAGNSLEDNAKSVASDLQNAFQQRVGEARNLYNPVFDQIADKNIYNAAIPAQQGDENAVLNNLSDSGDNRLLDTSTGTSIPPLTPSVSANPTASVYPALDNDIITSYDRKLGKLHTQFTANPTFQNAQDLQSQLGSSIRNLNKADMKGNLSVADRSTMQGYQEAQTALRSDMNSFLNSADPTGALANQYNAAQTHYATNVAPYLENPKIAPIAKGDITNPRNIASIFKNPEPETEQIVQDMGAQAPNKILYSELGKSGASSSPESFLNATNKLEQQGLSSYVTPSLSDQLNTLSQRIRNKKGAEMVVGGITGLGLAHPFGHLIPSGLAELGGAGIGGLMSHSVNKYLRNNLLSPNVVSAISKGASTIYPYISKALLANALPAGQQ